MPSASTSGPSTMPIGPNAATPPSTPMNTVSVPTCALPETSIGRRKLSMVTTKPPEQRSAVADREEQDEHHDEEADHRAQGAEKCRAPDRGERAEHRARRLHRPVLHLVERDADVLLEPGERAADDRDAGEIRG